MKLKPFTMKFFKIAFILLIIFPAVSFAQKSGLINSGELIKESGQLYDSAQYKKAASLLNVISRSDTNYVWSLYVRAIACEADSQYNKAIDYCREALARKEQREYEPDLLNTYGNTLNDLGRRTEAINVFDQAIAKYPSYALFYYNKGIVYLASEKPAEAEALFQKSLLINPYMYSAHFQLAIAAYRQGKLLPSFLSAIGYLSVNPQGKYWSNCITLLSAISRSTEEVMAQKAKFNWAADENYNATQEIIESKAALDAGYKPMITLDDPVSRQIQAVFEKLEYSDGNPDFWIQYYMPYFKSVFNKEKFEPFINWIFSNVDIKIIQDYNKNNAKQISAIKTFTADYYNEIRATREIAFSKRASIKLRYYFENGALIGKGVLSANGKEVNGKWDAYYQYGNQKAVGNYDNAGLRQGEWKFYYESGNLKSIEQYKDGKLEGIQRFYYENGNLSSVETFANDKAEGSVVAYFYSGAKRSESSYKNNKLDGERKEYHANGYLSSDKFYTNDILNGPAKEYFKNSRLRSIGSYINGKLDGPYKSYNENGALSSEGQYVKDSSEGEWKFFYPSGKLKERRNYLADKEEGLHQEYFENGQLIVAYNTHKAKITSEATFFAQDGKPYAKLLYDNGILKLAQYFDKAGHQLSSAELKDKKIDITSYTAAGNKREHFYSNDLGDYEGPDTTFYSNGTVSATGNYTKGETEGMLVNYYMKGIKKSEVNMVNGKQNGYYKSYHLNGQVESEGWMVDDQSEGEWLFYDELGRLTGRSYFHEGELSGYHEEYDGANNLTLEEEYKGGWLINLRQFSKGKVIGVDSFPKTSGPYKTYFANGKLKGEGTYINGELEGKYTGYYFDGSVEFVSYNKHGYRDSAYVDYYYGGNKSTEGYFKFGERTGTWKHYNEQGKLEDLSQYANDQLNGEKISYLPDGTKYTSKHYKNDQLDGPLQEFDPGGALAYQVNFEDDNAVSYTYIGKDGKNVPDLPIAYKNGPLKAFYANGNPSRICFYSNGTKNGPDIIYYANGQPRTTDTVSFGTYEGIEKEYYPNGKLKSVYQYKTGNVDGICREYYSDGTLSKEISYENGENHGPVKYYNEKGKLIKTMIYEYGVLLEVKNE